jgi:hypothetical protein
MAAEFACGVVLLGGRRILHVDHSYAPKISSKSTMGGALA